MSAKKVFFATLFGVCWSISSLQAQGPYNSGNQPAPTPRDTPVAASEATDTGGTGLSSWITYDRGDCCSGHGGGMPIYTEAAVRTGASIPVGGEYFSRNLDTGWTIEGSVRALFFNHEYTRAWTVELGMTNTYNPSHTGNKIFLDHTVNQFVTLVSLNRTFVTLALGGEWYLWAPANSDDARVRVGADIGGRWGSANAQFVEHPHSTDVIEGAYLSLHTDLEIPTGGRWTFLAGLRGEYGCTFSNFFAQGHGDVQDMLLMISLGARY